jgi:hypothetical protein
MRTAFPAVFFQPGTREHGPLRISNRSGIGVSLVATPAMIGPIMVNRS